MRSKIADITGWWALLLIAFFVTFPFWARPALHALGAVLGALNNVGAG